MWKVILAYKNDVYKVLRFHNEGLAKLEYSEYVQQLGINDLVGVDISPEKEQYRTIVVLSDGETYSNVQGCSLVVVSDSQMKELESGNLRVKDLVPFVEIGLQSIA